MFLLNTIIKSKSRNSLKNFFKLITRLCNKKNLRLNITLVNYLTKKNNSNKISVLTSPNANKNAQEQFLFKIYSKKATLFTFKIQKFLVLLKKIKQFAFSDVKIQLMFFLTNKIAKKVVTKVFNPESFKARLITFREVPLWLSRRRKPARNTWLASQAAAKKSPQANEEGGP